MDSLLHTAGVADMGWQGRIRVTGKDRLRWLSGMVTNTVQALPEGEGNFSFVLNAQGRIQGDCQVYRRAADLLLDSSRDQIPALLRHLEHYIIMDDVELEDVSGQWTALALIGPLAPKILATLGIPVSSGPPEDGNSRLRAVQFPSSDGLLVEAPGTILPRYELWCDPAAVLTLWKAAKEAGARPVGSQALEALRVLEGVPLYAVDIGDRDLPQETGQMHALHFSKGCYLGQEIVERIRSRGKVHRQFRQFRLEGGPLQPPFDLLREGRIVGRITSTASLAGENLGPELAQEFALGFLREEGHEASGPIEYASGVAIPLEAPPLGPERIFPQEKST
jgi:folate-binding protein YgfZ